MPNGISCAFFAGRNIVYGTKENNIFKEGIGAAQLARTGDAITQTGCLKGAHAAEVTGFFSKAAAFARKIVYPLIICSGVYNTVKSDDKVRTGASQFGGIATMYSLEQVAEKSLKTLNTKILNSNIAKNNKFVRGAWYIAKGLSFVTASLIGYNLGSKGAENIVDTIRKRKQTPEQNIKQKIKKENIFDEILLK